MLPRDEVNRRPDLRRRTGPHALLDLEHRRIRRPDPRRKGSGRRGPPGDERSARSHPGRHLRPRVDRREQKGRKELCRPARAREAAPDRKSRRAVARHDVVAADREKESRHGQKRRAKSSKRVNQLPVSGSRFPVTSHSSRVFLRTGNRELRTFFLSATLSPSLPWTSNIAAAILRTDATGLRRAPCTKASASPTTISPSRSSPSPTPGSKPCPATSPCAASRPR